MRLDFNVLWVDDQPGAVNAQIRRIKTQMAEEGFSFNPTQCQSLEQVEALIAGNVFQDEVDLILVDWDLGGVNLAYRALQKRLAVTGRKTDANGFTDEQRFFIAFAQLWATKCTPEYEAMQGATDPHPPGRYRVNGTLAHVPEFAAAFGLTEANCPLLLPEDKRCKLW